MPNPKLETYKNKATGTVYDYTDAAAQAALADILDGTDIDSFGDVETALATKVDKVTGKGLSTNDYDDTEKAKVAGAFPRSEQAVLGAKNGFNPDAISNMGQFTYSNGEFKNNATDTRANLSFNIQGRKNGTYVKSLLGIDCTATGKYTGVFTISDSDDINQLYIGHSGTSQDIKFTLPFTSKGSFRVSFNATGIDPSVVNGIVIKELMFLEPTDTDYTYAPFAMTNRELTTPKKETFSVPDGTLYLQRIGDIVYASLDTISTLDNSDWTDIGTTTLHNYQKRYFGCLTSNTGVNIKVRVNTNGKVGLISAGSAISSKIYVQDSCAMIQNNG